MKSKFIGANRLILYKSYSRADVGFKDTRLPGMMINGNERILFVNLGDQYDNKLIKDGLIHEPRLSKHINNTPTKYVYYLFIRAGNLGDYYYTGISKSQKRYNNKYNIFYFDVLGIPRNILTVLGGLQPPP
jgi:hypothetical protein